MRFDLFPSTSHLPPLLRGVYTLCAVTGTILLIFALFLVVVEITTAPGANRTSIAVAAASAVVSAAHVIREARSTRPFSMAQWAAFLVAQGVFAYELWITIRDPTARAVSLGMLGVGGTCLLIARLLVSHRASER